MGIVCDTQYLYSDIFNTCGALIRTLILDPTSIITDPVNFSNPFPVYETREEYDADTTNSFKGILVWYTHRYYAAMANTLPTGIDEFSSNAGFYVVPNFGDVIIAPNIEYKQMLAVTFDTNADLNFDPYGSKIVSYINAFANNVYHTLEKYGHELQVGNNNRALFTRLVRIAKGTIVPQSTFERRIAIFELRYCQCYCS